MLPHLLLNCPFDFSQSNALGYKDHGQYRYLTYDTLKRRIVDFACYFLSTNFEPGSNVAMLSENRPEWVIADMAIMSAQGVVVPVYPTVSAEQCEYIFDHCKVATIIVSTQEQYNKVLQICDKLADLRTVIAMDDVTKAEHPKIKTLTFDSCCRIGHDLRNQNEAGLFKRIENQSESDVCSIIYTSGTTGTPKGVMLTHGNFVFSACDGIHTQYAHRLREGIRPIDLTFLPLCHVFARAIYFSVILITGGTMVFAESFETIPRNLLEIRPTIFAGVPRVYEKIYAKIINTIAGSSPAKKAIFHRALGIGKKYFAYKNALQKIPLWVQIQHRIAQEIVFKKIQGNFGGRIQGMLSAGAKLPSEVCEFFCSVGLPISEAYGLTETSPIITCNRPSHIEIGSVGQPVRGVSVKIAEDGEILVRGPNVMKGYYRDPAATAAAIDPEGWFHTGDIGQLDDKSFLRITGRKKEIIVMSNGKKVPPAMIESLLLTSPFIEQVVLAGEDRKYIGALVVPHFLNLEAKAKELNISPLNHDVLVRDRSILALIQSEIDRTTAGKLAKFEMIKRFALLSREFSAAHGEVTPTLKIKRDVVYKNFAQEVEGLYQEAGKD